MKECPETRTAFQIMDSWTAEVRKKPYAFQNILRMIPGDTLFRGGHCCDRAWRMVLGQLPDSGGRREAHPTPIISKSDAVIIIIIIRHSMKLITDLILTTPMTCPRVAR